MLVVNSFHFHFLIVISSVKEQPEVYVGIVKFLDCCEMKLIGLLVVEKLSYEEA